MERRPDEEKTDGGELRREAVSAGARVCVTLGRFPQGGSQLLPVVEDLLLSLQGRVLHFHQLLGHLPGGLELLRYTC